MGKERSKKKNQEPSHFIEGLEKFNDIDLGAGSSQRKGRMTKEERSLAAIDQAERFFYSYYTQWRYAKILINEKVLKTKYEFLKDIAPEVHQSENRNVEALIAQQLSNGLELDSLANCIQYIEDLFALLKAGKHKDFFIRDIVTYNAGLVENMIKENYTDKELCNLFYFPHIKKPEDEDKIKTEYIDGVKNLNERIDKIKEFYKTYHFFYIQYKHGLTVALRPLADFGEEQIQKDKNGEMEDFYLVAFDNLALSKVFGNKYRFQDQVFIPSLTENTKGILTDLQAEDNLMRYVTIAPFTTFEKIKECAIWVKECMYIFANNFLEISRDKNSIQLCLPQGDVNKVYSFRLDKSKLDEKAQIK